MTVGELEQIRDILEKHFLSDVTVSQVQRVYSSNTQPNPYQSNELYISVTATKRRKEYTIGGYFKTPYQAIDQMLMIIGEKPFEQVRSFDPDLEEVQ